MKKILAIGAGFVLVGCAVLQKPTAVILKPISVVEFLEQPFGHNESIESFRRNLPGGEKVQKLISRGENESQTPDTIYNFKYKKSKIAVYKTQFNQEFMLGGVVRNPQIELTNGIRTGMDKSAFFSAFADLEPSVSNSIEIKHPVSARAFKFYFDNRGRLEKFTFSGNTKN